jgi:hypothetical protein
MISGFWSDTLVGDSQSCQWRMRAGQPSVDLVVGLKENRDDEDQKESEDRILTKRRNETNYKTPSSGRTGSQDFQQPLHRRLPENDINIIPFPIILPFWVSLQHPSE